MSAACYFMLWQLFLVLNLLLREYIRFNAGDIKFIYALERISLCNNR